MEKMATDHKPVLHHKLLRNLASNYVRYVALVGSSFILTPLLLHHLGARGYAIYAFVFVFILVLETCDAGIGIAVVRFVADAQARGEQRAVEEIVSTAFYSVGALGFLFTVLILLLADGIASFFFLPGDVPLVAACLRVGALAIACQMSASVLYSYLVGNQQFPIGNAVEVIAQLARLSMQVWLITLGAGLVPIVAALSGTMALRFAAMLLATKWSMPSLVPLSRDFRWFRLRSLARFSSLVFAESNLRQIFQQADMFIAARFVSLPQVALLGVVRRLPALIAQISGQASAVAYPLVASAEAQNRPDVRGRFMVIATRNWLFFALISSAFLFVWGGVLLELWVGREMLGGAPVLRILLIFCVASSLLEIPLTLLYGMGRIRECLAMTSGIVLVGITAGIWGVIHSGLIGLAWGIGAAQLLGTFFVFAYAFRLTKVHGGRILRSTILPLLPAAAFLSAWLAYSHRTIEHSWLGLVVTCVLGSAGAFVIYVLSLQPVRAGGWNMAVRAILLEE
jgi:O-antigen/teichoic acid export membrane protein